MSGMKPERPDYIGFDADPEKKERMLRLKDIPGETKDRSMAWLMRRALDLLLERYEQKARPTREKSAG
jgi:hypothetical protein